MLSEMLKQRNLPPLGKREEMLSLLQENVYGFLPHAPEKISFSVEEKIVKNFCAGHAFLSRVTCHCIVKEKEFSFPFLFAVPTKEGKHPFFVHINFRPELPDRYNPTEELIDEGFAVFSFDYNTVTRDNSDFTDGLAGVLFEEGKREKNSPGKIAMWAWAAMRVMDYAQTRNDLDLACATVCGHSRLGKTALLTGALDPRFAFVYSNDSGSSGAALSRGKSGETIFDITERFSYWFCENYRSFSRREGELPLDQHFLLGSIAPRRVLVGSASLDAWADPVSEELSCLAASKTFPAGFSAPDRPALAGEAFLQGDVGYHLREGKHYFSRRDWHRLIEFIRIHKN